MSRDSRTARLDRMENVMPRGSGIYEDDPREHRHSYSSESTDPADAEDPTPDDSASKDASEPTA
jgi:hypothetical protein